MKTMQKTLLITALLLGPLAAAQAQGDTAARHRAWIEAQKIDVQPTLTVKETQVPADSSGAQTQSMPSYHTPAAQAPSGSMPATPSSSSPGYTPSMNGQQPMSNPMPDHSGMGGNAGSGLK